MSPERSGLTLGCHPRWASQRSIFLARVSIFAVAPASATTVGPLHRSALATLARS
jgi:hypothetical protein